MEERLEKGDLLDDVDPDPGHVGEEEEGEGAGSDAGDGRESAAVSECRWLVSRRGEWKA